MPRVTIDGLTAEVEPGTSLIRAALKLGIHVPHYCWDPRLSVAGNCRMCLVEVEKFSKLQTACTTPCVEGMVVRTTTPTVKEGQRQVLEFLLLNHPLDCPICDKAGECSLQDLYFAYSQKDSVSADEKVHKPKNLDIGQHIILDAERCILCTRCIRFMDEVARDPVLGIVNRGDRSQLTVFPGRRLDSRLSLNTTDVCPVGALTSKDFRFHKRVWFLVRTPSVCPNCSTGCPVTIDHEGGRIYRMMPGRRDGLEVWLCDPGRLGFGFVRDQNRATTPLALPPDGKGLLAPVSWDEAIARIAKGVEKAQGAQGVAAAGIYSNWCTNEEIFAFLRLMTRTIGTAAIGFQKTTRGLVDSGPPDGIIIREDKNPNTRGAAEVPAFVRGGLKQVGEIVEMCLAGKVRFLWVVDPDLLGRTPEGKDRKRLCEALSKVAFVVVHTPFLNETAQLASVVLPAATWAEKEGTFTSVEGLVQRIRAAVGAPGLALPELSAFARVAERLGGKGVMPAATGSVPAAGPLRPEEGRPAAGTAPWSLPAETFQALAEAVPSFRGIRWSDLEKGHGKLQAPAA